ncbi:hypothetical protein D3C72_61950 [compost metagenome]
MKLACPACGAEVDFKSRSAVFAVCSYCQSTLIRHDVDLEAIGKMAQLPPDMSPLQVGTRGTYEGKRFELLGRLKVAWEDGLWNEWYALFDDGREGWLAEAQGFFMMSFPQAVPRSLPAAGALKVGRTITLASNQKFMIDDLRPATCIGSEGELPFPAPQGRESLSVDLSGPEATFANLEVAKDGTRLYTGKYVEFDELKLSNLRELDGW